MNSSAFQHQELNLFLPLSAQGTADLGAYRTTCSRHLLGLEEHPWLLHHNGFEGRDHRIGLERPSTLGFCSLSWYRQFSGGTDDKLTPANKKKNINTTLCRENLRRMSFSGNPLAAWWLGLCFYCRGQASQARKKRKINLTTKKKLKEKKRTSFFVGSLIFSLWILPHIYTHMYTPGPEKYWAWWFHSTGRCNS